MTFETSIVKISTIVMFQKALVNISNRKFSKKILKNVENKIKNFSKKLICEKVRSLSQKMMIYHKMGMSGVYENIF